jgi:hypothetical protein
VGHAARLNDYEMIGFVQRVPFYEFLHVALTCSASPNCYLLNAETYCVPLLSAHPPSVGMTLMLLTKGKVAATLPLG